MTARLIGRPVTFRKIGGAALSGAALFVRMMVLVLAMMMMVMMVVMVGMVRMVGLVGFNIDRGDIKSIVQLMHIRRALISLHSVKHHRCCHVGVVLTTVLVRWK